MKFIICGSLALLCLTSPAFGDTAEADKLFRSGDYFAAMKHYSDALSQTPNDAHALMQRGMSICLEGSHDATAVQDETQAILTDPNLALAYAYRGYIELGNGDIDHAISDSQQATKLDSKLGLAYATLAKCYGAKGDKPDADSAAKQALAAYSSELASDGGDVVTLRNRAQLQSSLGEYNAALEDYEHILQVDPDNLAGQDGKAWILSTCPLLSLRDGKKALELAKAVCEASHYEIASYYETLAAAHAEVGEFDDAVLCEQQFMRLHDPTAAETDAANARVELYRSQKPFRTSPEAVQHNGAAYAIMAVLGLLFLFCFVGGPLLWNANKLVIVPMNSGNFAKAGLLNFLSISFWLIEAFVGFYVIVLLQFLTPNRTFSGTANAFKPNK